MVGISRSCLKGGNGSDGGMPVEENLQPTMTANGAGAVAYAIENHAMDSRVTMDDSGIVQTLNARMGTGGGNVPLVLMKRDELCYAVDSHPMDSRIGIVEGACPSVTAKLAKLASDGPLVLVRKEE